MKKILSQFFALLAALLFTLSVYQANQYMQLSATIAPTLAQLNELSAAGGDAGLDAAQLESTRQALTAGTNSLLQAVLIDFVLGVIFLLAGYFTYHEK